MYALLTSTFNIVYLIIQLNDSINTSSLSCHNTSEKQSNFKNKWFHTRHCVSPSNDSSLNAGIPLRNSNKFIPSYIKPGDLSNKIFESIKRILIEHGRVNNSLGVIRKSRLDYYRDTIKETFGSAATTDNSLTSNDFSYINYEGFCRFDGDYGEEASIITTTPLKPMSTIINIDKDSCYCLSSCLSVLYRNFKSVKESYESNSTILSYIGHIEKLLDLSFGGCVQKEFIDKTPITSEFDYNHDDIKDKDFETRLTNFIKLKRLQLLRTLILSDTVFSINSYLGYILNNEYFKFAYINYREKEIFMLALALIGDYFINIATVILKYAYGIKTNSYGENTLEQIRIRWLHYLMTKNSSHIPMLTSKASIDEIQDHTIKFRLMQRKIASSNMFNLAVEPISVIQDNIEHIAQSHYKIEDTHPSEPLCGPIIGNRKVLIEELLERIESELISFENEKQHHSPFTIGIDEIRYVLQSDYQKPKDHKTRDNVCFTLFGNYILNKLDMNEFDISDEVVLNDLNAVVTESKLNEFIATLISHVIRITPKYERRDDLAEEYRNKNFIYESASGIQCKLDIDQLDEDKEMDTKHVNSSVYVVPLIDLCNHSSSNTNAEIIASVNKSKVSEDNVSFKLVTTEDIDKNSEIRVNYGNYDNNQLLLDYGFISNDIQHNDVLLEVEPSIIKESAQAHDIDHMLPAYYPAGLPKEKNDLLKLLNLIEIPKNYDVLNLYKDPHFEGVPLAKYCEFTNRFLLRDAEKQDSTIDFELGKPLQHTEYRPPPSEILDYNQENDAHEPIKYIKIRGDGIPDNKLILLLKITFCKTLKKLKWMSEQDENYLSTSINSPLDIKVFKLAASICCINIRNNYESTISDDLRVIFDKGLYTDALKFEDKTFEQMRNNIPSVRNSLFIAHGLRQKMPLYKCANFYNSCVEKRVSEHDR